MSVIWSWYCIQCSGGVADPDTHLLSNPDHNIIQVIGTTSNPTIDFVLHTDLPSDPEPIGNIDADKIKSTPVDATDIEDGKILAYDEVSDTLKYVYGNIPILESSTEPTLSADNDVIFWKDLSTTPNKIYLVLRRGSSDQVKVELTAS